MRTRLLCLLMILAVLPARADEPLRRRPSLSYENVFLVRVNPLGLGDELKLRMRLPLYASTRPALAQNFFGVVTPILLAPSFLRPGIGVEVQPLSLLHFYVGYEPAVYFGAVGSLRSYPSANADYGYGALQLGGPPSMPGDLYSTVVHQLVLAATAQFAHRWFAFRSAWRAQYVDADLRNGDPVFYDPLYGTLLPRSGWMVHGETTALYKSTFGLSAGLQYLLTLTWYPSTAYAPGEPQVNQNTPIQKLGPLVAYTFSRQSPGRFEAPTLFLTAAWYLQDRFRAGQTVSQGIPMIGVGFSFRGTLFGPAPTPATR
jgi:hypothetical protein